MNNNSILLFFGLLLGSIAFLACGNDDDDPGMGPFDITSLDWQIYRYTNQDVDSILPVAYTFRFDKIDEDISVQFETNSCGSDYVVNLEENQISFPGLGCTEACCDSEMAETIKDLLSRVGNYEIVAPDLILRSGFERVTLRAI